mmetsp:Transcript_8272/g.10462  ORF Transcript_8272/g.10462 Transcript_8272/m.10462 type:complete len:208 (+) Transcript_8272:191-814(+)
MITKVVASLDKGVVLLPKAGLDLVVKLGHTLVYLVQEISKPKPPLLLHRPRPLIPRAGTPPSTFLDLSDATYPVIRGAVPVSRLALHAVLHLLSAHLHDRLRILKLLFHDFAEGGGGIVTMFIVIFLRGRKSQRHRISITGRLVLCLLPSQSGDVIVIISITPALVSDVIICAVLHSGIVLISIIIVVVRWCLELVELPKLLPFHLV